MRDNKRIEELFNLYYRPLCLLSLHYTYTPTASEDIVQECFVGLLSKTPDNPKAYLYAAVRNPRVVEMSGKVRFTVAKDEAHPFTVASKNAFVEVLGTVFTLSDNPAKVEVEQGCVRFARSAAAEGIVLTKGESAEIRGGVPQRMGAFAFDDTPLEDVIASLSEFYGVRLRCNTLGKRLSAEFRGECLEDIVGLIEDALDVRIIVEE